METQSRLRAYTRKGRKFGNALSLRLHKSVFHPAIAPLCQLLVHASAWLKLKFLQPNWYEIKLAHCSGKSFVDCASALKVLAKSDREANFHAAAQTQSQSGCLFVMRRQIRNITGLTGIKKQALHFDPQTENRRRETPTRSLGQRRLYATRGEDVNQNSGRLSVSDGGADSSRATLGVLEAGRDT